MNQEMARGLIWTVACSLERVNPVYVKNCPFRYGVTLNQACFLKTLMGEISNIYHFSPRLFIFGTHPTYNNYTCCKVPLMSLIYYLC